MKEARETAGPSQTSCPVRGSLSANGSACFLESLGSLSISHLTVDQSVLWKKIKKGKGEKAIEGPIDQVDDGETTGNKPSIFS